jgi:hypothetical protein
MPLICWKEGPRWREDLAQQIRKWCPDLAACHEGAAEEADDAGKLDEADEDEGVAVEGK